MSALAQMQTVLLIGGTSGIGEAAAQKLHALGNKVIITGRRHDRLTTLASSLPGLETYRMDIAELVSLPSDIKILFSTFPDIDTVWINAGISQTMSLTDPDSKSDEDIVKEITTNFTAPILLARHVLPLLRTRERPATIIITSSRLGFVPSGGLFPVYGPTKAAIHSFTVGLRQVLKGSSVSVLEVVPPYVATDFDAQHRADGKIGGGRGPQPMPLGDFIEEIFEQLRTEEVSGLREVAAGGGVAAVKAWRESVGGILESTGSGD